MRTGLLALVLLMSLAALPGVVREKESPSGRTPEAPLPFTLPPGFEAERVAGPPLVEHPMMAHIDERGRLWVTGAAGVNLRAKDLLNKLPNRIRVLEDTDGDGRFDRSTVFVDGMTLPMGVLRLRGALYSASPPSLWKITERGGRAGTGGRTASTIGRVSPRPRREELVTRFGFSGNAASIHGPFLGPDGWLYWTDGRHGHEIRTREGTLLKGKAARIFRCRPDGRNVEVVCGGGMDDPVEIAFTPEGEGIATVNILHSQPRRVDALIHCIEGGVFPYHSVVQEFQKTGDLLPPVTDLGWVAPVGLMRYRSDALGVGFQGSLFATEFNTHKVRRHILKRVGASFTAQTKEFLSCTNTDFHPTDVLEDADGSLLVVDTGGWFRIGCPTSRIAKPQVKGGIYRIRRKGSPRGKDPRGQTIAWDTRTPAQLTTLLNDKRWMVRDKAIEKLVEKGTRAIPTLVKVLRSGFSERSRRNAVWALCRIDTRDAHAALRLALADRSESVCQSAAHSLGLLRDRKAGPALRQVLKTRSAPVKAAAATALGRIRNQKSIPTLLDQLGKPDRFLEHALVYALIQIGDAKRIRAGLRSPHPAVQRGALIALNQLEGNHLTRQDLANLLPKKHPGLRRTVLDILARHAEWGEVTVGFLRKEMKRKDAGADEKEQLTATLLALCRLKAIQQLIGEVLRREGTSHNTRTMLLGVIRNAPLKNLPEQWVQALKLCLNHKNTELRLQAVQTVRQRLPRTLIPKLKELAKDGTQPSAVRLGALMALSHQEKGWKLDDVDFTLLTQHLASAQPPLIRLQAASILAGTSLTRTQLKTLTRTVGKAGPLVLANLLLPFEQASDPEVGEMLVAALSRSPGIRTLSSEDLDRTFAKYPGKVRRAARSLRKRIRADEANQRALLAEMTPLLRKGNPSSGQIIFFGAKAACSACHTVRRRGGKIGPDLSRIGAIRSGQDLLEAILLPSSSIVRGYQTFRVTTRKGQVYSGILGRQTTHHIVLINAERAELSIAKNQVESLVPSTASIMPQGLEKQLTKEEFRDLLAYLQSLK